METPEHPSWNKLNNSIPLFLAVRIFKAPLNHLFINSYQLWVSSLQKHLSHILYLIMLIWYTCYSLCARTTAVTILHYTRYLKHFQWNIHWIEVKEKSFGKDKRGDFLFDSSTIPGDSDKEWGKTRVEDDQVSGSRCANWHQRAGGCQKSNQGSLVEVSSLKLITQTYEELPLQCSLHGPY